MKSHAEIEKLLEQLGNEWPSDSSLASGVLQQIESKPVLLESRIVKLPAMKSLLAIAATLAVVATLWWTLRNDNKLYAQAIDAIERARTFHMITTVQLDNEKVPQKVAESWYERGVGFRESVGDKVRVGNQENFWTYVKGSKLAIRSQSRGIDDIVDRVLDNEELQLLRQQALERYPEADQEIDGNTCKGYVLKPSRDADPSTMHNWRLIILIDHQSRIKRVLREARTEGEWVLQSTSDWKYDVPIDHSLFEADFGDDVKIVDADAVFDAFFNLDTALHHEERAGVWYAIHHIERIEGGGVFLVSSVRGTEKTLEQFPLTRRRVGPGRFSADGPAENYSASPQGSGFFRIELASADHQGINVRWWVLVPRGTSPTHFDAGPGRVKLPVGVTPRGEFAKANFADERGVIHHLTWNVVLDVPEPNRLPSLDEIARRVYADQVALEAVPFRRLDMGTKDAVKHFSNPTETTMTEFSNAVASHVRDWFERDIEFQLEGQFTMQKGPDDFVRAAADSPVMGFHYNPFLSDATLARIAHHNTLKHLYLDGTKITDAGLKHLVGLNELRTLSLEGTPISDAGLAHLQSMTALQTVNVRRTRVSAEGVAQLKAAIPELKVEH